jgi:hypothetical protein
VPRECDLVNIAERFTGALESESTRLGRRPEKLVPHQLAESTTLRMLQAEGRCLTI